MTNLQAAIGQSQLWRIDRTLARNRRIAELYHAALAGHSGRPPSTAHGRDLRTRRLACLRSGAGGQAERGHLSGHSRPGSRCARSSIPCRRAALREVCPRLPEQRRTIGDGINLPTSRVVDEQIVERVAAYSATCSVEARLRKQNALVHYYRWRPRWAGAIGLPRRNKDFWRTGWTKASLSSTARNVSAAVSAYTLWTRSRWAAPISSSSTRLPCRTVCDACVTIRSRTSWRSIVTVFRRSPWSTALCAASALQSKR